MTAAARLAPGKPATDTTAIEHLDWQPPCECFNARTEGGQRCCEPAVYLARIYCPECQGRSSYYACERHVSEAVAGHALSGCCVVVPDVVSLVRL